MKVKVSFEIGDEVTHKASFQPLVVVDLTDTGRRVHCRYYVENTGEYKKEIFIPEELTIEGIEGKTVNIASPEEKKADPDERKLTSL